jgi:hypothetical protein
MEIMLLPRVSVLLNGVSVLLNRVSVFEGVLVGHLGLVGKGIIRIILIMCYTINNTTL